jgi:hypothetical protein
MDRKKDFFTIHDFFCFHSTIRRWLLDLFHGFIEITLIAQAIKNTVYFQKNECTNCNNQMRFYRYLTKVYTSVFEYNYFTAPLIL